MSGSALPKTGAGLAGTTLVAVGGFQVSTLAGVIVTAIALVAVGAVLVRFGYRRGRPAGAR